jgi:hypothetical protein
MTELHWYAVTVLPGIPILQMSLLVRTLAWQASHVPGASVLCIVRPTRFCQPRISLPCVNAMEPENRREAVTNVWADELIKSSVVKFSGDLPGSMKNLLDDLKSERKAIADALPNGKERREILKNLRFLEQFTKQQNWDKLAESAKYETLSSEVKKKLAWLFFRPDWSSKIYCPHEGIEASAYTQFPA